MYQAFASINFLIGYNKYPLNFNYLNNIYLKINYYKFYVAEIGQLIITYNYSTNL